MWTLLLAAVLVVSCDAGFTPFAPGVRPFTVYGHLDPDADTQWIRVELMRTQVNGSPEPNGVAVTLEDLATGHVTALRERVGRLSEMAGGSAYVHNFWTDERITAGHTYRFLARQPSGDTATAIVKVPSQYSVEVWLGQAWAVGDAVRVRGSQKLAFITQTVVYHDSCETNSESRSISPPTTSADTQVISLTPLSPLGRGCRRPSVDRREIWLAGADRSWPNPNDYSTVRPGAAEAPSNVSNALGFLGAVVTKRVPYEICQYAYRLTGANACVLRYDGDVATLRGTAYDIWCRDSLEGYKPVPDTLQLGGPYMRVARVAVTLKELDPKANVPPRIRKATTDWLGTFTIGALDPGRYELSFFRDEIPDSDIIEYNPVVDTVVFAPRQQVSMEVPLVGQVACRLHPRYLW